MIGTDCQCQWRGVFLPWLMLLNPFLCTVLLHIWPWNCFLPCSKLFVIALKWLTAYPPNSMPPVVHSADEAVRQSPPAPPALVTLAMPVCSLLKIQWHAMTVPSTHDAARVATTRGWTGYQMVSRPSATLVTFSSGSELVRHQAHTRIRAYAILQQYLLGLGSIACINIAYLWVEKLQIFRWCTGILWVSLIYPLSDGKKAQSNEQI